MGDVVVSVEEHSNGSKIRTKDNSVEVVLSDGAQWYVDQRTYAGDVVDAVNRDGDVGIQAKAGAKAEIAVVVWLSDHLPDGWDWDWYTDDLHSDIILISPQGDAIKVDVKARIGDKTVGRDLLVEPRRYSSDEIYDSDVYIQCIVYGPVVTINGWASRDDAMFADWFELAKSHDTKLIPKEDLRSLSSIFELSG